MVTYCSQFQDIVNWHIDNLQIDYRDPKTVTSTEEWKNVIARHTAQQDQIDEFEDEHRLKIYLIKGLGFKNEIQRSPKKCLKEIREYLPDLAYTKLSEIADEFREMD